jgi:type IV pilus assembly protein PilO
VINLRGGSGSGEETEMGAVSTQRLWLWAPIAAGGALSAVFLLAVALPLGLEIGKVMHNLRQLEQHRQEIERLSVESEQIQKQRQRVQGQEEQLVQLMAGRQGDLSTFLATLDLEAEQAKVSLELYEPVTAPPNGAVPGAAAAPPAAAQSRKHQGAPKPAAQAPAPDAGGAPGLLGRRPAPDAMGRAGLRERSLVLVASGTYPQLLEFLRRMERLEVLVEQKDLSLKVREIPSGKPRELPPIAPIVDMKLSLTLWSKDMPEGRKKTLAPPASAPSPPPAPAPPAPARPG